MPGLPRQPPLLDENEDEMLRRAIAMSLEEEAGLYLEKEITERLSNITLQIYSCPCSMFTQGGRGLVFGKVNLHFLSKKLLFLTLYSQVLAPFNPFVAFFVNM